MDIKTGKALSYNNSILQSIRLIILTPKKSRVLNMGFGSDAHNYLDNPVNTISMPLSAEIISSLEKWDTRIKVDQVVFDYQTEHLTTNIIYNTNEIATVDLT